MKVGQAYHPHQTYICEHHTGEYITNFCQSINCLVPLCPQCITEHFQMHQSHNTHPDIETIAKAQQNCNKKLNAAVKTLQKELDKAQLQSLTDPEHMRYFKLFQYFFLAIHIQFIYIEKVKQKVLKLVDQYFTHMESNLAQKIHENQNIFKTSNFEEIVQEVNQLIVELQDIGEQLHSPYQNSISAIKNIMLLDLKSLMEKFKSDIKRTVKNLNLASTKVIFDESKIHDFKDELERLVFIEHEYIQGQNHPSQKNRSQTEISPIKYINYAQNLNKSDFQIPPQIKIGQNQPKEFLESVSSSMKVEYQNYFQDDSTFSGLHYFNSNPPQFITYQFPHQNEKNAKVSTINLEQGTQVPQFHKTIATPQGEIFLIGGNVSDEKNKNIKSKEIIQLVENQFYKYGDLQFGRSSHSLTYLNGYIYIINGLVDQNQVCNFVERYNVDTREVELMRNSIMPTHSQSCCSFNDQFILKIGGKDQHQQLSMSIELYDSSEDTWIEVDPHFQQNGIPSSFILLCNSGCAQISPSEIFIFGGYDEKSNGHRLSYILSIDDKSEFMIECVNKKPLLQGEGFQNGQAIIHDNCLYAIQTTKNHSIKSFIQYNGFTWNNIN